MSSEIAKLKALHDRIEARLKANRELKEEIIKAIDRVIVHDEWRLSSVRDQINALDLGVPYDEA